MWHVLLSRCTAAIRGDERFPQDHLGMPLVPFGAPLDICLWYSGLRAEAWRGPWAAHLQQRRTCSPGSKTGLRSALLCGSTARNAYTFGKERVGEGGRGRVGARCVSQAAEPNRDRNKPRKNSDRPEPRWDRTETKPSRTETEPNRDRSATDTHRDRTEPRPSRAEPRPSLRV